MDKKDARTLSQSEQGLLRRLAIRLRERGLTFREIGQALDVHPDTVGRWWRTYENAGIEGLQSRRRGPKPGQSRHFTMEQERRVLLDIIQCLPDELGLPQRLWSRQAVSQLVGSQTGGNMPIRTVGEYLRRWGLFTRNSLTSSDTVTEWHRNEYPAIRKRALAEGARLFWANLSRAGNCSQRLSREAYCKTALRSSAPGTAPELCILSARASQGALSFMVCRGAVSAQTIRLFARRLAGDNGKKVVFLLSEETYTELGPEVYGSGVHLQELELIVVPSSIQ